MIALAALSAYALSAAAPPPRYDLAVVAELVYRVRSQTWFDKSVRETAPGGGPKWDFSQHTVWVTGRAPDGGFRVVMHGRSVAD